MFSCSLWPLSFRPKATESKSFAHLVRPEEPSLFVTSCLTASAYVRQPLSQLLTVREARQNFGRRVANLGMRSGNCGKILISGTSKHHAADQGFVSFSRAVHQCDIATMSLTCARIN
ncbi:hypothetical protein BU25DRAFT_1664 [Macroventuria anomochaeta]|uniref:Uncharacterized protein n=1 Tax=Macroventuria anomochaeta TaxID=301207 RepID=A0ACB6SFV2_9PLEO|nr:uncharacterized protein BU25DRAFT_1664 [Macroventuria anomochaeta]KAF2633201.1 hypothetical protein BU25DRAFT_1664 [Macroventuria anomochaeta]